MLFRSSVSYIIPAATLHYLPPLRQPPISNLPSLIYPPPPPPRILLSSSPPRRLFFTLLHRLQLSSLPLTSPFRLISCCAACSSSASLYISPSTHHWNWSHVRLGLELFNTFLFSFCQVVSQRFPIGLSNHCRPICSHVRTLYSLISVLEAFTGPLRTTNSPPLLPLCCQLLLLLPPLMDSVRRKNVWAKSSPEGCS